MKINVTGNGNVEIVENETSTTLTAAPITGYDFKHYVIDGVEIKHNPYTFDNKGIIIGEAVFYASINSYLNEVASFDVSGFVSGVIRGRGISYGEDLNNIDSMTIELCEADLYMRMTRIASSRKYEKNTDGSWSHDKGSLSISSDYRATLIANALAIYIKHGDPRADDINVMTDHLNPKTPVRAIINSL